MESFDDLSVDDVYEVKLDFSRMTTSEFYLNALLVGYRRDVMNYMAGMATDEAAQRILKDPESFSKVQTKIIDRQKKIEERLREYTHLNDSDKVGLYHEDDYTQFTGVLIASELMTKTLNPNFVTTEERRIQTDPSYRSRINSRDIDPSFG